MRTNTVQTLSARTYEGATVPRLTAEAELHRSVLSCLLFENSFYESGQSIGDRIAALAIQVPIATTLNLAVEARERHGLRHVPLWLVVAALDHPQRATAAPALLEAIGKVCDRADLPGELLAQYWKARKRPLAAVLKRGLSAALQRFDAYQLSKYAARGAIRTRDVLFLTHAKPKDDAQAALWKQLADDTLQAADTWEVELSAGSDKRETFTRLLQERKLGGLALLRNLRNMNEAGVDRALVAEALGRIDGRARLLPFQFIAAARACPGWEDILEPAMLRAVEGLPKLPGRTVLLVDCSGSMNDKLSAKSTLNRIDAARALAILLREVCEQVAVVGFNTALYAVPPRRGFALADAIPNPNGGTYTGEAVKAINKAGYDRIVVITDEQSHSALPAPVGKAYVMNVASYQNGIAWGPWVSITGFSENVVRFIHEAESQR